VKLLVEKGAELDSKDEDGQTPLLWAAFFGHEAVAKLLVEKGAELDSKNKDGLTPLFYAASRGREAVVKLLVEKGAKQSRISHFPAF
jgi:ankyrin repeat protein